LKREDFSWMIGGVQGSGVDTSANVFARAAAAGGLHVFGKREYYSNIKGEHSYFQVRVSKDLIRSHIDTVDMLATYEEETIFRHALEVRKEGAIIYDPDQDTKRLDQIPTIEAPIRAALNAELTNAGLFDYYSNSVKGILELARRRGVHIYPVPYNELLKQVGSKFGETSLSSLQRMLNVMAVAASFALLSYDEDVVKETVKRQFRSKPKVAEMNAEAVSTAYNFMEQKYAGSFATKLSPVKADGIKLFVRGNSMVAMAKELAGCRLQTYYPITPASDESEFLEGHSEFQLDGFASQENPQMTEAANLQNKGSIAVVQSEDEIAAITMAIGGGLAGVRSSTSTSGPGFSLMAEGMGYAGMNEVPVVITLYSRGGPSTGLPTRHEQGDLRFALHAGHGEFPRLVLASGDLEEAFYDTVRAFNYSEKYQTPVIHIVDKALANSDGTLPMLDVNRIKIDRGEFQREITDAVNGEYERFKRTSNGISPRPPVGAKGGVYWHTGDEHNELGHISEDPSIRDYMMEKRMGKIDLADREIPLSDRVNFFGPERADITVVSWGSTKGAILDAMEWLDEDGIKVNFLQIRLVHPFPTEYVTQILSKAKKIVGIEMNYSAQLIGIVRERTCIPVEQVVVKYNGRPMSAEEVYDALKMINEGKATTRTVLKRGA